MQQKWWKLFSDFSDADIGIIWNSSDWLGMNSCPRISSGMSAKLLFMADFFYSLQVLITKLRSANNVETQQYRKASKALLVLIPLLGVTYVLVLAGPEEGQVANVFTYSRAFLLSSQVKFIRRYFSFCKDPLCLYRNTNRVTPIHR